ncbi:MAG TPA: chemotaxis protein CheX [Bryobacteraceae bacterium]|jgi:CheY-specific phosphatase CheX|nr:chemotaxis protein CheX [Bryobacteraceae bacterium]
MQAEVSIQDVHLSLSQSVLDVLESMCFTMVDGPAEPPGEDFVPRIEVELSFSGARRGDFWLSFPGQTSVEIAAAFSGSECPDDEKIADVMSELANIMCGATLSRIPENGLFDLDSPVATWIVEQRSIQRLPQACRVDFQIGPEVVSAGIHFRADA